VALFVAVVTRPAPVEREPAHGGTARDEAAVDATN